MKIDTRRKEVKEVTEVKEMKEMEEVEEVKEVKEAKATYLARHVMVCMGGWRD